MDGILGKLKLDCIDVTLEALYSPYRIVVNKIDIPGLFKSAEQMLKEKPLTDVLAYIRGTICDAVDYVSFGTSTKRENGFVTIMLDTCITVTEKKVRSEIKLKKLIDYVPDTEYIEAYICGYLKALRSLDIYETASQDYNTTETVDCGEYVITTTVYDNGIAGKLQVRNIDRLEWSNSIKKKGGGRRKNDIKVSRVARFDCKAKSLISYAAKYSNLYTDITLSTLYGRAKTDAREEIKREADKVLGTSGYYGKAIGSNRVSMGRNYVAMHADSKIPKVDGLPVFLYRIKDTTRFEAVSRKTYLSFEYIGRNEELDNSIADFCIKAATYGCSKIWECGVPEIEDIHKELMIASNKSGISTAVCLLDIMGSHVAVQISILNENVQDRSIKVTGWKGLLEAEEMGKYRENEAEKTKKKEAAADSYMDEDEEAEYGEDITEESGGEDSEIGEDEIRTLSIHRNGNNVECVTNKGIYRCKISDAEDFLSDIAERLTDVEMTEHKGMKVSENEKEYGCFAEYSMKKVKDAIGAFWK